MISRGKLGEGTGKEIQSNRGTVVRIYVGETSGGGKSIKKKGMGGGRTTRKSKGRKKERLEGPLSYSLGSLSYALAIAPRPRPTFRRFSVVTNLGFVAIWKSFIHKSNHPLTPRRRNRDDLLSAECGSVEDAVVREAKYAHGLMMT